MKSEPAEGNQPGNTAKDKLAHLGKEEEIREKRRAEIDKINKTANSKQHQAHIDLQSSGIDFSQDPKHVTAATESFLNSLEPVSIYYDQATGLGYAKEKFQFVLGEVEANVFAELFEHMNEQLDNKTVLKLMGKKTELGGTRSKQVSDLAKRLREITGISSNHLTAKRGTLTLIGKKLSPP